MLALLAATACSSPERGIRDEKCAYEVRVLADGHPLAHAQVAYEQPPWVARHYVPRRTSVITNEGGIASHEFEEAQWTVAYISAPGRARARVEWDAPGVLREVTLEPETVVHGRVVDELGRPARHAKLVIDGIDNVVTDDEGAFTLHGLRRGDSANVWTGFGGEEIPIGDDPVLVKVPAGGAITVTVVAPHNDEPTADLWSCLLEERIRGRWYPATAPIREVAKSQITLRALRPGVYRTTVRIPRVGCDTSAPHQIDGPEWGYGSFPHIPMRGRSVTGVVTDSVGPLRDALVRFGTDDPDALAERTDADGRFVLRDMPREDTFFFVSAPGFETIAVPLVHGDTSVGPIILARAKGE